jgi:membrane-bound ClpP family serine protease
MWKQGPKVDFDGGLTFARANELDLASDKPISMEAVGNKFGIEKLPPETRTNATEQFVEWLGGQGWLSMLLFVVGIIALSAELSTPGVGIAGIISAICFLLFFWIHLFQGTVEWLEILLILAGIVCLAAELFVLPGFGVFGVTGLILLAIGLLLAGQTFVFPTNDYQWHRTAQGIGQLGLIVMSLFVAAIVFRKQLANLPMVRWFALQPPKTDQDLVEMEHAMEELRSFIGWHGTTISRCNPSGKASIGDRVFSVVSHGAWIDEDSEVEVVGLQENTLIVKPR